MINLSFSGQQLVRNEDEQTPRRQAINNNIQSYLRYNEILIKLKFKQSYDISKRQIHKSNISFIFANLISSVMIVFIFFSRDSSILTWCC